MVTRPQRAVLFAGVMLAMIAGCGGGGAGDDPPRVVYGEDACRQCFMIISEARYAAAYVDEDGVTQGFDDIGCVTKFLGHQTISRPIWVADYASEEWVRADQAWFVASEGAQTPMGYGVVGFADEAAARKAAETLKGTVRRFDGLLPRTTTE